jgi:hypothetical protein
MLGVALAVALGAALSARQTPFNAHDDYTEYNLLDPASHKFHIVYFLAQRTVGAQTVLNQTRSGSAGSDMSVSDPQTGQPLKFEYKTGAELAAAGEKGTVNDQEHYIRAFLPRPVPEGGESRVRIQKTYLDQKSYFTQGDDIVFDRSLGIGRNSIVLPPGYVLVSSNVAAQIMALADGRVKVAFENVNTYPAAVVIRGRKTGAPVASSLRVAERAFDFAKTLYDLQDPETRRIMVRHEYVETAPGARALLTFLARHVLTGLAVTDMDTGKPLEVVADPRGRAAVLAMPLVNPSQSAHLRVSGVEQDSAYRTEGGQLFWEKTLHEPRTTILLPAGWDVMAVSTPATVSTTREGRVAIQVYNPRPEPATLNLRASRRPGGGEE